MDTSTPTLVSERRLVIALTVIRLTPPEPNYTKSNQLQLLLMFHFNYN